ncbi:MAG: HAMP domain-containing protein [Anaeromyxobacteraceae bacterium]|nr:HAMP domain-containing protein [Anaeromyxobacteraceae bacterium]
MSIVLAVRSRLSVKISLLLAVLLLVLTAGAAAIIMVGQTRQMEELTLEKARLAASSGARQWGDVFDAAIDAGQLTVADVFDRNYQEIKGWNWGANPKFHTRFDTFTDKAVLVFQDRYLDSEDFIFAVGVDETGYLPTHNTRFQKPLTGDPAQDLVGNRTKRVFNDPVGAAAAKNTEPTLKQVYRRDTGETLWDVSSPIYVKGKHWGGFRIGVSMTRIEARQRGLLVQLFAIFTGFAAVTILTVFLVVQRAMRPVKVLTEAAEAISMGEGLDTPIKTAAVDEIGHLTRAVERLRVSMRAAMSRLSGQ